MGRIVAVLVVALIMSIITISCKQKAILPTEEEDTFAMLRQRMVTEQLMSRDITDKEVLTALGKIERHRFVPAGLELKAYDDNPLPIGYGQTISQPYIVALMTQSLEVGPDDKVLEIGTGSGYQAAVLAELVDEVYTIEIIGDLSDNAYLTLDQLYDNVKVRVGDGYFGWPEEAPFDAVIVTAAANHIPPPLIEQLRDGGKLIIPLGDIRTYQTLTKVTKQGNDTVTEFITSVTFVPLTGKALE